MSLINFPRIGLLSACLFSLTMLVAAPGAVAETKVPAPIIAVIDYQVILRKSSAIKSVREQAEMHRKKLQSEITNKEKKLRADRQALAQQRVVLSPEAFAKRQSELQSKMIEVQGQVQVRKRQLFDEPQGILVVGLSLARKACNDIGTQADSWHALGDLECTSPVRLSRVPTFHAAEDRVGATLQRHVQMGRDPAA